MGCLCRLYRLCHTTVWDVPVKPRYCWGYPHTIRAAGRVDTWIPSLIGRVMEWRFRPVALMPRYRGKVPWQVARGGVNGKLNRRNRWCFRRVGVLSRYAQNSPRLHSLSAREPLAAMRGTRGGGSPPPVISPACSCPYAYPCSCSCLSCLYTVAIGDGMPGLYGRGVDGECPASGIGYPDCGDPWGA